MAIIRPNIYGSTVVADPLAAENRKRDEAMRNNVGRHVNALSQAWLRQAAIDSALEKMDVRKERAAAEREAAKAEAKRAADEEAAGLALSGLGDPSGAESPSLNPYGEIGKAFSVRESERGSRFDDTTLGRVGGERYSPVMDYRRSDDFGHRSVAPMSDAPLGRSADEVALQSVLQSLAGAEERAGDYQQAMQLNSEQFPLSLYESAYSGTPEADP